MLFCLLHPPQLSTLPTAATTSTASKAINGASGDSAAAPVQTAELVGVEVSASVGSAAGSVHPAYAGELLVLIVRHSTKGVALFILPCKANICD